MYLLGLLSPQSITNGKRIVLRHGQKCKMVHYGTVVNFLQKLQRVEKELNRLSSQVGPTQLCILLSYEYIISFCQFGAIQSERVRTFVQNCCNKQCLFVCSRVRRLTFSQPGFFYYSFFLISRSSNFNSYHSSKKIKWKSRMKRRKMISLKIWKVWLERERERDVYFLSEDVGGESYNCMK